MKIYYSFTFHPKFINDSLYICARSTCTCIKDRQFDNNQSGKVSHTILCQICIPSKILSRELNSFHLFRYICSSHAHVSNFVSTQVLQFLLNFLSTKSVILFLLNYQLNTLVSLHCTVNHLFMPIPVSICMRCTNFKNISQKNTDNLWCKIFSLTSLFKKAKSTKNSSKVLGFLS